jgi:hypothetical protein
VPAPCSPCPAPVPAQPARRSPSARAPVRTKGRRRRLRFLARLFHLARAQLDPRGVGSRRRLRTTRSQPSSPSRSTSARRRLTTRRLPSPSFTVAKGGEFCKITVWRRRSAQPLYVRWSRAKANKQTKGGVPLPVEHRSHVDNDIDTGSPVQYVTLHGVAGRADVQSAPFGQRRRGDRGAARRRV